MILLAKLFKGFVFLSGFVCFSDASELFSKLESSLPLEIFASLSNILLREISASSLKQTLCIRMRKPDGFL